MNFSSAIATVLRALSRRPRTLEASTDAPGAGVPRLSADIARGEESAADYRSRFVPPARVVDMLDPELVRPRRLDASLPPMQQQADARPPSAPAGRRQRAPVHLLQAAARLEEQRLAGVKRSAHEVEALDHNMPDIQVSNEPQAVLPSEVLVRRSANRALHMIVHDADDKYLLISWHNDADKAIEWRIAFQNLADAVRRVFLSSAFAGCTFSISAQLLQEMPEETQGLVRDAITSGAVKRSFGGYWRYEGTIIVLAECGTGCEPLASFDCAGEPEDSRRARFERLLKPAQSA